MNDNDTISREDRLAVVILAVTQSLLLLILHKTITHDAWPSGDWRWLFGFYSLVIGTPLFLYLGAQEWRDRANAWAAAGAALLLFVLGWHQGWLNSPDLEGAGREPGHLPGFILAGFIAIFILALYFRSWREYGRLDYALILDHAWRNALMLAFLGLFLGVFWLLLLLWAQLFDIIGIGFFKSLFDEPEFVYPVSGLVGGFGIGLIRLREAMIATVRRLCEVLIRALLPLAAFIVLLFLAALPFTGLQALWDTGFASALLLMLSLVLLFFFNAVAAESGQALGAKALRWIVTAALVLLPIAMAIALWSLGLRIGQYGITVDRAWALFIETFVALMAVAYAGAILLKRKLAFATFRRINLAWAAALAVTLILVNLPPLDFTGWSARSQLARLHDGKVQPADFDARYFRFGLGAYGVEALKQLQDSELAANNPVLRQRIDDALKAQYRWSPPEVDTNDLEVLRARYLPLAGTEIDDDFLRLVAEGEAERRFANCMQGAVHCVVGELTRSNQTFRFVISRTNAYTSQAWQQSGDSWRHIGSPRRFGCRDEESKREALRSVSDEYFVFTDGICLYQLQPLETLFTM